MLRLACVKDQADLLRRRSNIHLAYAACGQPQWGYALMATAAMLIL